MRRKCDAEIIKNLILRGRVYYYRMDFQNSDGKRRAFRRSLRTSDFCTAVALVKQIKNGGFQMNEALSISDKLLARIQKIDRNMSAEEMLYIESMNEKLRAASARVCGGPTMQLVFTPEQAQRAIWRQQVGNAGQIEVLPTPQVVQAVANSVKKSISIEDMIQRFRKANDTTCAKYSRVRAQRLYEFVGAVGLTPQDDFRTFVEYESAQRLFAYLRDRPNTKARTYSKMLLFYKQLVEYAILVDRELYDTHILAEFPKSPKLKKADIGEHKPFTAEELKRVFGTDVVTFDKKPDLFWVCVIALYIGSRQNAAFTLKFKNIVEIEEVWCIDFVVDDPIKQFKNTASERIVPIHPQMLELGFLEMVAERRERLGASDDDFIFPTCKTKSGAYNGHITRDFCNHLQQLGIKTEDAAGNVIKDGKDMHSLRNNASLRMYGNVEDVVAEKIIGWGGKSTRESHYSKFDIRVLVDAMTKYNYDEIMPELRYWADRLRGK